MQEVEDLKEILTATQDLGVAWQNLLVELSAENSRLIKENKNLRADYEKISAENKTLRNEINNLSEKVEQLHKNLREEIFKEFKELDTEDFQKFVKDYLKKIRECVEGKAHSEKPKENSTVPETPLENFYDE